MQRELKSPMQEVELVNKKGERIMAFGQGGGGGFRGPRQMHPAVCSDCGAETQVPFKPIEGKPVYCRDCYQKHKKQE